ncbi:uncharacterized protein LOC106174933 isoform X2 [Lingula anatina]|uniref:Uncharacterized protein LOC106174933 isoform X2 n=1 Tax=Lingula anatina TaxID=7574 RepID=A0A1S3JP73_LINAN|nr:uncharacterized protein LOC106174933 isoform X2 [Lingula anatina]|eukprot:XP_013412165.1 uncharacterized protein LOC106174933 isoform X2 [Lingula anatina]
MLGYTAVQCELCVVRGRKEKNDSSWWNDSTRQETLTLLKPVLQDWQDSQRWQTKPKEEQKNKKLPDCVTGELKGMGYNIQYTVKKCSRLQHSLLLNAKQDGNQRKRMSYYIGRCKVRAVVSQDCHVAETGQCSQLSGYFQPGKDAASKTKVQLKEIVDRGKAKNIKKRVKKTRSTASKTGNPEKSAPRKDSNQPILSATTNDRGIENLGSGETSTDWKQISEVNLESADTQAGYVSEQSSSGQLSSTGSPFSAPSTKRELSAPFNGSRLSAPSITGSRPGRSSPESCPVAPSAASVPSALSVRNQISKESRLTVQPKLTTQPKEDKSHSTNAPSDPQGVDNIAKRTFKFRKTKLSTQTRLPLLSPDVPGEAFEKTQSGDEENSEQSQSRIVGYHTEKAVTANAFALSHPQATQQANSDKPIRQSHSVCKMSSSLLSEGEKMSKKHIKITKRLRNHSKQQHHVQESLEHVSDFNNDDVNAYDADPRGELEETEEDSKSSTVYPSKKIKLSKQNEELPEIDLSQNHDSLQQKHGNQTKLCNKKQETVSDKQMSFTPDVESTGHTCSSRNVVKPHSDVVSLERETGSPSRIGDGAEEVIHVEDDSDVDAMEQDIRNMRNVNQLQDDQLRYMVEKNEKYLRQIFEGKRSCLRHEEYKKGGVSRYNLDHNQASLCVYLESQNDAVMETLIQIFCKKHNKYLDYLMKVLLPEALIKIYMDVHQVGHAAAEEALRAATKNKKLSL